MAQYVQKHKQKYGYDSGDKRAEIREMTERHAAEQELPKAHDHTDEVMADIDEALEGALGNESAQDFVQGFRQQGGE